MENKTGDLFIFNLNITYGTYRYYPINDNAINYCKELDCKSVYIDKIETIRASGFIVKITGE